MNYPLQQNFTTQAGLIEHQVASIDQTNFIKIAQDSSLKIWLHDEQQSVQEKKVVTYHIMLEKNAQLVFLLGILHAKNLELVVHLYLHGDGSKAEFLGVCALAQEQTFGIKTYQMHYGANTSSSVILKNMLKDQAQADVHGLIFIDQTACKTDASQENKNIVMGTQARVVSIPSIEVLQHDVACCHGTAVGQFDEKHRWYLQSRGLDANQVHHLLISSFFGEVVQKFENNAQFMEMLCKKML
jgi:Fe-S cluster assembly scaffold protein SufB